MPGLFVTFEGGDGSGKSTQLARMVARLQRKGLEPVTTREPGGTPLAEGIRELLLDPASKPDALAEAFLIEAARSDSVARVVKPALEAGRVVLCDRHADSTLAYQGYGRGLDRAMLEAWNRAATGGLEPDLTLLYDLDPSTGSGRRAAASRPNRIDLEAIEFHTRVRRGYLDLARLAPQRFVVLDAALDQDEVEARSWAALEPLLSRWRERVAAAERRS